MRMMVIDWLPAWMIVLVFLRVQSDISRSQDLDAAQIPTVHEGKR